MKFCKTEEEFVAWAKRLYQTEQQEREGGLPQPIDIAELMHHMEPETIWADGESDYRRGFTHGIAYAVELIESLRRSGYHRPSEISNIIDNFNMFTLYPWRYNAHNSIAEHKWREGHPKLNIESWREIREKVFERDFRCCVVCRSPHDLECDHIEPVRSGGLPKLENLQTLCGDCNRKKGSN